METPSWEQVWTVFEGALGLEPEARSIYLERHCGDDAGLRQVVEQMLAADQRVGTVLDVPVGELAQAAAPTVPEPIAPAKALDTIGPYRLLRRLAQGGMSTVYLAVRDDDAFQRRVVVKLIRHGMESDEMVRRMRIERQILASLNHPFIARLYDGGTTQNGLPYFVMEYIDGVPFDEYCHQSRLSIDDRITLFLKVCEAVSFSHRNLVIHRDLKPSNILVGVGDEPKLLDFGIAKLLNPDLGSPEAEPTATAHLAMTPSYASPEQIRGKLVTTGSDVYSLGVVLYEVLTGRRPFDFSGKSAVEIERIITEQEPILPSKMVRSKGKPGKGEADAKAKPPARSWQTALAGDLDAIVLKALQVSPRERYSSVEQLAADLERYRAGLPVLARRGTWRYRSSKFLRRHRVAVLAAVAAVIMLLAFAGFTAWQSARVRKERDLAQLERDKKQQVLGLMLEVFDYSNPFVRSGEALSVREALELSLPVLQDRLQEQPDVRAELLFTSGSILSILGHQEVAQEQLEQVQKILRKTHAEDSIEGINTLRALAAAHRRQGNLERAESLARDAVERARRQFGDGHPNLAPPLNELVSVLCTRSEYEAAEPLAHEALEIVRDLPQSELQEILALEALGLIHNAKGDYRSAADFYRQGLTRRRARYGETHPSLINPLNNLAIALRRQDAFAAAETAYRELIEIERLNFDGKVHPMSYANLAGVRIGQQAWDEAQDLYQQALKATVQHGGHDHWMVFPISLGLAQASIGQGAAAQAETDLRGLLEAWSARLGPDHLRLHQGNSLLGAAISVQGRCDEAEPLLVDSYRRLLDGAKDRHKRDALSRLRGHLERCGRPYEIPKYEAMLDSA